MTETNRTHCSLTENETSLKIIVLFQHACIHGESEGCGNTVRDLVEENYMHTNMLII